MSKENVKVITVEVKVDTTELDAAIEKANQLTEILRKSQNNDSLTINQITILNSEKLSVDEIVRQIADSLRKVTIS